MRTARFVGGGGVWSWVGLVQGGYGTSREQTDKCKNITLRLRVVKIVIFVDMLPLPNGFGFTLHMHTHSVR